MVINIEKKFLRKNLNENELQETNRLAKKYKLDDSEINLKLFRDLKQRINIIPVSLALAQAIVESGWDNLDCLRGQCPLWPMDL